MRDYTQAVSQRIDVAEHYAASVPEMATSNARRPCHIGQQLVGNNMIVRW